MIWKQQLKITKEEVESSKINLILVILKKKEKRRNESRKSTHTFES